MRAFISLWELIQRTTTRSRIAPDFASETFADAVDIYSLLTQANPMLDPATPFAVAREWLEASMTSEGGATVQMADELWMWMWQQVATTHFRVNRVDPTRWDEAEQMLSHHKRVPFPTEPLRRYLDLLTSTPADPWTAYLRLHLEPRDIAHLLPIHAEDDRTFPFICGEGHITPRRLTAIRTSFEDGDERCPECLGWRRIRGVNSIYELHPLVVSRIDPGIHPELFRYWGDGPIDPTVSFDSPDRYRFVCAEGHSYNASLRSQIDQLLCPDCDKAGQGISEQHNLATFYPRSKRLWCSEFYPELSPSQLSEQSHRWFWWHCDGCDFYFYKSVAVLITGSECPYCAGTETLPFLNDAESAGVTEYEWDDEANGFPLYLVGPGYGLRSWWRCPLNHPVCASWRDVAQRKGCRICGNRALYAGFNDVAHALVEYISRWDPALNHGMKPEQVLAAGSTKRGWRCPRGHPYWKSAIEMRRNPECSVCLNKRAYPDFNVMSIRYARIISDFDIEANDGVDPAFTLPTNRPWFWTCEYGHTRYERAVNRLRTGGCPDCPLIVRLAA
jgi:hypothetical protein